MEQGLKSLVRFAAFCVLIFGTQQVSGQLPNKVGSLLTAERTMARMAIDVTPYQALLSASDENTILFSPGPVEALSFLKNRPNVPDRMHWEPHFAGIAKSMELGFTTGTVDFQRVGSPKRYGEYLSVWMRNNKGEWKLRLRAIVEHYGKSSGPRTLSFIEPDSAAYFKQRSQARLRQRTDIISSNDQLFSTVLRSDNHVAYKEFLAEDVRFYFPWNNPIHGQSEVLEFLREQEIVVETTPLGHERSYSGEMAYSYGHANVAIGAEIRTCNYIRIWQRQPDHQWKVLIEFYSEK